MFGLLTCPVAVCTTKPSDLNAMMWEVFITDIRKTRTIDENFNLAEVTASLLQIGGRVHVATSKLEKVLQDMKDQAPPTKSQKASLTRTQESQPVEVYTQVQVGFLVKVFYWGALFL
jgi:hypothetical protein